MATLTGAHLTGANLRWAILGSAKLADAYLDGANLDNAYFGNANLTGANLDNANFADARCVHIWYAGLATPGTVRQLIVTGLGRDAPTVIITSDTAIKTKALIGH